MMKCSKVKLAGSVVKQVKLVLTSFLIIVLTLSLTPTISHADSHIGEINPIDGSSYPSAFDDSLMYKYAYQKTVDISDTDVNIQVSPQEQTELRATATNSALSWLGYILALETLNLDNVAWSTTLSQYTDITKRYWYDNVDTSKLDLSPELKALVNKLVEAKDIAIIDSLTDAEFKIVQDTVKSFGETDRNKIKQILNNKITEIYNDKFSDLLIERLTSQLNVKAHFKIESLAADGSDDEKYGIDEENGIYRGTQITEPIEWDVDFTNKNQFYDSILSKFMLNQTMRTPFGSRVWTVSTPLMEDGRDLIDHVLFIDGGAVISSNDSQYSYAGLRDVSDFYPGWHCLLEVCDSLGTYSWARYGIPGTYYAQTFNLHLNPSVEYMMNAYKTDMIFADLLTNATFDEDGRLLTFSKPLLPLQIIGQIFNGASKEEKHGLSSTYRYKLVETRPTVSADNLTAEDFNVSESNIQYIDVVWAKDKIYVRGINGKTVIELELDNELDYLFYKAESKNGELVNKASTKKEQETIPSGPDEKENIAPDKQNEQPQMTHEEKETNKPSEDVNDVETTTRQNQSSELPTRTDSEGLADDLQQNKSKLPGTSDYLGKLTLFAVITSLLGAGLYRIYRRID